MAILRITDHDILRTIRDILDTTGLETLIDPEWSYSSQRLSELSYDIRKDSSKCFLFYESCLQEDDVTIFDTSALQLSSERWTCWRTVVRPIRQSPTGESRLCTLFENEVTGGDEALSRKRLRYRDCKGIAESAWIHGFQEDHHGDGA